MKRTVIVPLAALAVLLANPAEAQTFPTVADLVKVKDVKTTNPSTKIANQYIVTLKKTTATNILQPILSQLQGLPAFSTAFELLGQFESPAFTGFAAKLGSEHINRLLNNDLIESVEEDFATKTLGQQNNPPSWGLDRLDQRPDRENGIFDYNNTGSGVNVYVIDTGVFKNHRDFQDSNGNSRVTYGFSAIDDGKGADDGNGHGTHVAGTIGGTEHGVAKDVNIISVRVLDDNGSGSASGLLQGLDWVRRNHVKPAVACMSLGGEASDGIDRGVRAMIDAGVLTAVAAGNSDVDACETSPARVPQAITVGASTIRDERASFSNWGTCVDIFAPGQEIVSTYIGNDRSTKTLSGTSMAAPHVAGALAQYLFVNNDARPSTAAQDLDCFSTKDAISDTKDTPNRLLFATTNSAPEENGSGMGEGKEEGGGATDDETCDSGDCESYNGRFSSSSSDTAFAPPNDYYTTSTGGKHRGWLSGKSDSLIFGADFDIILYQYNFSTDEWEEVASSRGPGIEEKVVYDAPSSGTFVWVVSRLTGNGEWQFDLKKPSAPAQPSTSAKSSSGSTDQCSTENTGANPDGEGNAAPSVFSSASAMAITTLTAAAGYLLL